MAMLHRYWVRFRVDIRSAHAPGTLLGIGVTAYNRDDALEIIAERVYKSDVLPEIATLVEDVDMSTLDEKHVLPNIGNVFVRGVWYPGRVLAHRSEVVHRGAWCIGSSQRRTVGIACRPFSAGSHRARSAAQVLHGDERVNGTGREHPPIAGERTDVRTAAQKGYPSLSAVWHRPQQMRHE